MRLTIVGCSGSAPAAAAAASCYLVEADGYRLLLDLGSGALAALQAVVPATEIDAVFLSHLHPDHSVDMASLAVILKYGAPAGAARPVIAPMGAHDLLRTVYTGGTDAAGESFEAQFEFRAPGSHRLGPLLVRTVAMRHPVPAYAVRVEHDGRSLVYSGDTAACPELVALARGADVLLCEAAWAGSQAPVPGIHLSGREAGEHAAAADVGRLLITHVPAWESLDAAVTSARSAFGGDVVGVRAGETYAV